MIECLSLFCAQSLHLLRLSINGCHRVLCCGPTISAFCNTEGVAFCTLGSLWGRLTMVILDFIIRILCLNYNNDLLCTWHIFHLI